MKIQVISVGKLKEKYLKDGVESYAKRLRRFCEFELIEVEDERLPEPLSAGQELQVKAKEAERIRAKISDESFVIALDVKGEMITSEDLAGRLERLISQGRTSVAFVIGGSLGFDLGFLKGVDWKISMSQMTFPHQLARLALVEQIDRVFSMKAMRSES